MSHTNCSFQNCFELLLLWLLRQDRIKIRTVLVATSLPSSGLSNDEEDSRGSRDRAAATSGVRGEEGGRGPGGWETRIKAYTDETIDDIKSTLRRNMDLEKEFLDEPGGEAHPLPRSGLKHRSQSAAHCAL